ncbi:MAG: hypothetical protein MUC55_09070 [Burkholderiales bacterium]|jgi:hypothetical protein|nr:hypothetical protein [Burkholderiales bacterium]
MRWIAVALGVALAGAAAAQVAAPPVRIVETRTIDAGPTQAPFRVRLAAYTPAGGPWTAAEIDRATRDAAAILGQCGIGLALATLSTYDGDPRFRDYFTPWSRLLARALPPDRPALFFVADTRNRPAFDAEAIGRGNARTRPELTNTVWVAFGTRDLAVALAHELAHVLADSGEHSDEPGNLMAQDTSPSATRLTAAQCARIVATGEANGLLSR